MQHSRSASGMSVVRIAVSNPIVTHEQLAAQEFEPWPEFVGFDKNPKAMEEHEQKLRSLGIMSRFAIGLLSKTKQELIESVRAMDKDRDEEVNSMNFLEYMSGAREKVEALLSFITAAEIRQACAMANVYSDDGDKLPPIPKPPEPTLGRRRSHRSTEA
jgi:hypothetical protein